MCAGGMCPRFWGEQRKSCKVISVVSQWHLASVASAVTQLLCQHSSDGVIFLGPPGARSVQVCIAPHKKRTNNNRKWSVLTGKASPAKIRRAQVKMPKVSCLKLNLRRCCIIRPALNIVTYLTFRHVPKCQRSNEGSRVCFKHSLNTTWNLWHEEGDHEVYWDSRSNTHRV